MRGLVSYKRYKPWTALDAKASADSLPALPLLFLLLQ